MQTSLSVLDLAAGGFDGLLQALEIALSGAFQVLEAIALLGHLRSLLINLLLLLLKLLDRSGYLRQLDCLGPTRGCSQSQNQAEAEQSRTEPVPGLELEKFRQRSQQPGHFLAEWAETTPYYVRVANLGN